MKFGQVATGGLLSVLLAVPIYVQAANQSNQSQVSSDQDQAAVMTVQKKLKDDGDYNGKIDGMWGRQSVDALKKYQKDKDLQASGTMDQKTADKLDLSKPEFSAFEEALEQGHAQHTASPSSNQSGSGKSGQ